MEVFALGKGVANLEDTIIRQTNDIARVGFFYCALALCHELGR